MINGTEKMPLVLIWINAITQCLQGALKSFDALWAAMTVLGLEQCLQNLAIENRFDSRRMALWMRALEEREAHVTDAMEHFIITQNIAHYKMLLERETHPDKRGLLLQLLENEIGKLPSPAKHAEKAKFQLSTT